MVEYAEPKDTAAGKGQLMIRKACPGSICMDEIYEPKKGFEDLFDALLKKYTREIQEISDTITKQDRRSDETLEWVDRKVVDAEASLEALAAKYKPLIRALSDSVTEIPKVK